MKTVFLLTLPFLLLASGCMNSNLAWRGTNNVYYQDVSTDGSLTNTPTSGDTHINAEKTTDAKVDVVP